MLYDSSIKCNLGCNGLEKSPVRRDASKTNGNPSDLYNVFGVGVGEALELVLVQVHDEELVRGRQLDRHLCELLVEVADVTARFLPQRDEKEGKESEILLKGNLCSV